MTNLTQWKEEAHDEFLNHPAIKAADAALVLQALRSGTDGYHGPKINTLIDSVIDRIHAHTLEEVRNMSAVKNLKENQGQLDEDGVMVAVSRQALCELFAALELLEHPTD